MNLFSKSVQTQQKEYTISTMSVLEIQNTEMEKEVTPNEPSN